MIRTAEIAESCIKIAEDARDASGFVPLQPILQAVDAALVFRPLLVEALLCVNKEPKERIRKEWIILVNSDIYALSETDVAAEVTDGKKLPVRLRNTVAHEIVHTFTTTGGSIPKLNRARLNRKSKLTIKSLEREAESLSSLLLVPQSFIRETLDSYPDEEIPCLAEHLRAATAVSRGLALNRLNLLNSSYGRDLYYHQRLRNVALFDAIAGEDQDVHLKPWPRFGNFDRNVIPQLVWKVDEGITSLKRLLGAAYGSFLQHGHCTVTAKGGTKTNPTEEEMSLSVTRSRGAVEAGSRFYISVRTMP